MYLQKEKSELDDLQGDLRAFVTIVSLPYLIIYAFIRVLRPARADAWTKGIEAVQNLGLKEGR